MKPAPILDLFILAALDQSPGSPYDLNQQWGISLGGSLPALRRLAVTGAVERSVTKNKTKRPRHEYRLKPAGKTLLRNGLNAYLKSANSNLDVESVLRIVDIGLRYAGDRRAIKSLLQRAAKARLLEAEQESLTLSSLPKGAARLRYHAMKLHCDAERAKAESQALSVLAGRINVDMDDIYDGRSLLDALKPNAE